MDVFASDIEKINQQEVDNMKQIAKYNGDYKQEIPQMNEMKRVSELYNLPKELVAVFVSVDGTTYLAGKQEFVPVTSELLKDESGQIYGIPVVTGG